MGFFAGWGVLLLVIAGVLRIGVEVSGRRRGEGVVGSGEMKGAAAGGDGGSAVGGALVDGVLVGGRAERRAAAAAIVEMIGRGVAEIVPSAGGNGEAGAGGEHGRAGSRGSGVPEVRAVPMGVLSVEERSVLEAYGEPDGWWRRDGRRRGLVAAVEAAEEAAVAAGLVRPALRWPGGVVVTLALIGAIGSFVVLLAGVVGAPEWIAGAAVALAADVLAIVVVPVRIPRPLPVAEQRVRALRESRRRVRASTSGAASAAAAAERDAGATPVGLALFGSRAQLAAAAEARGGSGTARGVPVAAIVRGADPGSARGRLVLGVIDVFGWINRSS